MSTEPETPTTLDAVLAGVQGALNIALGLLPAGTAEKDAEIAQALIAIISKATQAYEVHAGERYDLSLLTPEEPV